MSDKVTKSRERVNMNREDIRSVLESMRAEEEVIQTFIKEDITVEDLKTLTKRDLDELIKKYGPKRRFGKVLIEWMSSRGLPIDLQLLTAYGNVQSAQIYKNDKQQPFLLTSSSNSSPSTFSYISINNDRHDLLSTTDISFSSTLSIDSPITINSEESIVKSEEFEVPSELNVKDFIADRAAHFEHEVDREVPEFQNEIKDFTEAIQTTSLEAIENNTQQRLSVSSIINIEDPETRNPLMILLRKNGHCQKLVDNPCRNDMVPEGKDINLIARITVKHLINLATPPKRKIPTSILTKWAEYFKRLFPKTPVSSFYAFKYESSRTKNGTIVQKKRAEGALQVQLFQERRKLIKEDRTVLLRCPSANYITDNKNLDPSSNTSINRNTWKLMSQQKGEEVRSCNKVSIGDSDIKLRVTGALLLLPFIFTHAFVEKTWKPTRIDIMDSFVTRVCNETEIQEHIELRRRKSLSMNKSKSNKISSSIQPYVLAVGPSWENIVHAHIIVDRVLYTCETIVEATELCFKLFHAYHSDYPPESKHVWQLIQQGFYKLFVKNRDLNRRTISKALADIGIELNEEFIAKS
ncbi:uncharacterized protein LOC105840131 isoform X3 [Monomorium pharaonis]|uniref:uncharacterized protein LOC105840131 isoform X3 n=1 Tax=Monomorium pharaonis TaxID=307658 RepID=UPI00063F9F8B|nr:uncharacterized protein LOC105840131 isoform X3 [Monomorium pharaonis]